MVNCRISANRRASFLLAVVAVLALAPGCGAFSRSRQIATVQDYEDALRDSPDAGDRALLRQIANGPADLAREKVAAAAAGIALTDTTVPPPDSENAAPLYLKWQARKHGKLVLPIYAEPLSLRYAYTPEQIARIQAVFSKNADLVALRNKAISKPRLYTRFDPSASDPDIFMPVHEAYREIVSQSFMLARSKDYGDAITLQQQDMQIARQLYSQPQIVRMLVGIAAESAALRGFQTISVMAGPNAAVDEEIRKAISSETPAVPLAAAVVGDLPLEMATLETFRRDGPAMLSMLSGSSDTASYALSETNYTPSESLFVSYMVDESEALLIGRVLELSAASTLPALQRRKVFYEPVVPDSRSPRLSRANYFPNLANTSLSLFASLADREDTISADKQVTLAVAAIMAAKARSGHFPRKLPGSYPDPFSSGQLGYRREGADGFVVYSVGTTGRFDGGKPGETRREHPLETFFRYPLPTPVPVPVTASDESSKQ